MEQQADLYQQARQKYDEASIASDDIFPRRATLELEAEALVKQAAGIDVDRDVIRVVIPDLPETTPGIDADPGPLPPGSDDASSMTEPTEDDAVRRPAKRRRRTVPRRSWVTTRPRSRLMMSPRQAPP